jgi:hypothetical protein
LCRKAQDVWCAGSTALVLLPSPLADQPPGNDAQQRADERREQVLKRDLEIGKTEVNAEQPEEATATTAPSIPMPTLSPGMYFGDFEAKFEGTLIIDPGTDNPISRRSTVREALFAPLPTVGLSVDYKIFPRLMANLRADFFYVDIDEIEGGMTELVVGLEYRVFKHFAVGAAYNRFWLNVDYKPGKSDGWEIDAAWNGGFFYGALYF